MAVRSIAPKAPVDRCIAYTNLDAMVLVSKCDMGMDIVGKPLTLICKETDLS